jgi:hypothetical protein
MSLRRGGVFSTSFQGNIEIEMGSYALGMQEVQAGEEFEHLIRIDGLGEFAIPDQAFKQVKAQPGSENLTPGEYTLALLGKALELGCKKV